METRRELRRHPRKEYRGAVHVGDGDFTPAEAQDISALGVGVMASRPVAPGTPVQVAFLNRSVAVRGQVRFARPVAETLWRIGVEFDRPEPDILDVLLRFQREP